MTKVLVVDDSALMRRLISGVLTGAGFQVAAARNGVEGVEQLTAWEPDVVTLDINMPEMDGLTALSLMMQARPTPVVMVSSLTAKGAVATFEALALGAVDFIAKPGGTISLSVDEIAEQLIQKVKAAARSKLRGTGVGPSTPVRQAAARPTPPSTARSTAPSKAPAHQPALASGAALGRLDGVVIIGVSTGGPRTLEDIVPTLPADFPWPVLVAQHMPSSFTDAFARRMDGLSRLNVRECNATTPLEPGCVYIGKGGTDMVVVERLGRLAVQPRPETPGHPWHPSVDVLVDSAMKCLPPERIVGVQLTGMGDDGARAMTALKQRGGRTIAESKDTAVVFGMPAELIERGGASLVLPCTDVSRQLCHWILKKA
ncbi:MAG: chemotaxis response regulator protein-glutamate methylesterase [Burkholderiales bacterium PBB5]|nr:MAG: chemotaxis response regulator protein-glutamate methylesterase [Burkholderiales bacterium PBB5]